MFRGNKDILRRRLKSFYKKQNLSEYSVKEDSTSRKQCDFVVVIDFEATCEKDERIYPHEIIEFPAVLVNVRERAVVSKVYG